MTLALFDANCGLGRLGTMSGDTPATPADLGAALERAGIDRALVYPLEALAGDPWEADQRLLGLLAGRERFTPCWVVAPHQSGEFPEPGALLAAMAAGGVRAARLCPREQGVMLRPWHVGPLAEALEARRIPLFLDFGQEHWSRDVTDWDGLQGLCASHPALPVVLVRADLAGSRRLYALMAACPNLHIETSYYTVHRGIEGLSAAVGAERILFGTGLPLRAPGPAITALSYGGLGEAEAALVAGGNLRRLLEGVRA